MKKSYRVKIFWKPMHITLCWTIFFSFEFWNFTLINDLRGGEVSARALKMTVELHSRSRMTTFERIFIEAEGSHLKFWWDVFAEDFDCLLFASSHPFGTHDNPGCSPFWLFSFLQFFLSFDFLSTALLNYNCVYICCTYVYYINIKKGFTFFTEIFRRSKSM